MESRAQRAQQQFRARGSPTGTACLIGKKLINMAPQVCPPASSRTPWSAKTSQMGLLYPATPKIYNFPPPNPPTSEHHHPPAPSAIVYIYLLVPPTPTQQPHPITHPALPSGTLGRSPNLPAHLKDLFVILTSPGTHGHTPILTFFGWWGIPGVD